MNILSRRYTLLAAGEALIGSLTALVTSALYFADPKQFHNASLAVVVAGCGAAVIAYYLSIHLLLKAKHLKLSTIIMSVLTALNLFVLITATGGVDSPYYSIWLLGIVTTGLFGRNATVVVLVATLAFFGYDLSLHGWLRSYAVGHSFEYVVTILTAFFGEWVHSMLGHGGMHESVANLSGKLTQESLKSEALITSVSEGVMIVNTQRQIQLFNPSAVKMTGWDASSAQGIDCRLVLNLHAPDGTKVADADGPFTELWQTGKSLVRNDLTMETKNGHKTAVSLSLSPIYDNQHAISGAIALFRDITAEKAVERQRTEFISTASHEMRTPVAAIEGYLSLAMNPAVATIDDRAKQYLDKAHHSTQHLGELFRDLLSITKMEDNRLGAAEVFDLTALVKEAVSDMKFEADKKGIDLFFGASQDKVRREAAVLPIYAVTANEQRMREVVMNLIENAIKFTPEGHVEVNITGTNDTVTVSVVDTGIGIAQEDIPHLFQKFYRIDNSATRTIGGTGLGLFLCRSIIEHAGGQIEVASHPNEGSTFKFRLPRLASEKIAEQAAANAAASAAAAATPPPAPALPAPVPAATSTPVPASVATALEPARVESDPPDTTQSEATPVTTVQPAAATPSEPEPAAPAVLEHHLEPSPPLPGSRYEVQVGSDGRIMTDIKKPAGV